MEDDTSAAIYIQKDGKIAVEITAVPFLPDDQAAAYWNEKTTSFLGWEDYRQAAGQKSFHTIIDDEWLTEMELIDRKASERLAKNDDEIAWLEFVERCDREDMEDDRRNGCAR